MPGIPREVAEHELRILLGSKPVQQRLHRIDDERRRAIGEEIAKLLAAGFIKEVYHSDWLSVGAYQRHLAMTPADANLGRQYFMNHE